MKQVTAFMASDGSLHGDSKACVTHELALGLRPLINDFFDEETRYSPSVRTGYMKLLLRWEAFKLRQADGAPEAKGNVG